MKRRISVFALLAAGVTLAGCASLGVSQKKIDAYLADKPQELHPFLTPVVAGEERNRVLNQMRAGLAAMKSGHSALAARLFDDALLTIEAVYGGDQKAAKARGLFSAEDRKVFRGEPYERAMIYYYRGILYLMEGDYENARASFKSGYLQDTLAEKEKFRGDFALLTFLEGWASQCNGNPALAREAYAQAKEQNSRLVIPDPRDNALILADLGYAPVKYAAGQYGEALKIRSNKRKGPRSVTRMENEAPRGLPNGESVLWQARTRGGREFDAILANKVVFKQSAESAASVGAAVSAGAMAASNIQAATGDYDSSMISAGIGAAGALFSLFSSIAADSTKTAADIRQWSNLPEKVAYGTYRNDNAPPQPELKFDGTPARAVRYGGDKKCSVAWANSAAGNVSSIFNTWKKLAGKTFEGRAKFTNVSGQQNATFYIPTMQGLSALTVPTPSNYDRRISLTFNPSGKVSDYFHYSGALRDSPPLATILVSIGTLGIMPLVELGSEAPVKDAGS